MNIKKEKKTNIDIFLLIISLTLGIYFSICTCVGFAVLIVL